MGKKKVRLLELLTAADIINNAEDLADYVSCLGGFDDVRMNLENLTEAGTETSTQPQQKSTVNTTKGGNLHEDNCNNTPEDLADYVSCLGGFDDVPMNLENLTETDPETSHTPQQKSTVNTTKGGNLHEDNCNNNPEDVADYVSCLGGFDDVIDNKSLEISSAPPVKTQPGNRSTSTGLQPAVAVYDKPCKGRKLSVHELSLRVFQSYSIKNIGGALYGFNGRTYEPIRRDDTTAMLRRILLESELVKLDMRDFDGCFGYLRTITEIKMDGFPVCEHSAIFENGLFDILTHVRREIRPTEFFLYEIKAKFLSQKEETPTFDAFVNTCADNNPQIKRLLLAVMGYCLLPDQEAKAFFVFGTAQNSGKSVLAAFLQRIVGQSATSSVALNDMGNEFALAPLVGKVLNVSMDLPADPLSAKAVSRLKMLTGGDTVTINEKYQPMFKYKNCAKLVFATNYPVLIRNPDPALFDRMVLVPFMVSVPKEDQDKKLPDKLWEERDGIVYKAMKEASKLVENNYIFPTCDIADAIKASWETADIQDVVDFIKNSCIGDPTSRTFTSVLYAAFAEFCADFGLDNVTVNSFSRSLTQLGYKRSRWSADGRPSQRGFLGIKLKPNPATTALDLLGVADQ